MTPREAQDQRIAQARSRRPDADALMSGLREMVKAEAMLTLFETGAVAASAETKEQWGLQYSRHETVAREQLRKLVDEACSFKREPRLY